MIIQLAMAALCTNDHIWEMAPGGPRVCPRCGSPFSVPVAKFLGALEGKARATAA